MKPAEIEHCRSLANGYASANGGGSIGSLLGAGGSAAVFKWMLPTAEDRALKVYDPAFFRTDAAPAERHRLEIQRRLNRPGFRRHQSAINYGNDGGVCEREALHR